MLVVPTPQDDAHQPAGPQATQYSIQQDHAGAGRDHDYVPVRVPRRLQPRIQLRREYKLRVGAMDRVRQASNAMSLPQGHGEDFDGNVCPEIPAGTLRELAAGKRLWLPS